MSANVISWRRIKALNRSLNERFVHAVTWSHGHHWVWYCIRHDGSSAYVDTKTLEVERPDDGAPTSTTAQLLATRSPRTEGDKDWLRQIDERQAELDGVDGGG